MVHLPMSELRLSGRPTPARPSSAPRLLMVGAHHQDLADAVHEPLADALRRVVDGRLRDPSGGRVPPEFTEAVLLRTCARTELYLVTADPAETFRRICALVGGHLPGGEAPESQLRFATAAAATRHLFRTASGLESAVLGEAEVLGQVRAALADAHEAGGIGPVLTRLVQDAVAVGRRVRSETRIGEGSVSLTGSAVDWAEGRVAAGASTALVLGAGRTGRSVAHRLAGGGWKRILIANRTLARARELAAECGGEAVVLGCMRERLFEVDAVFAAIDSDGPVLGPIEFEMARAARADALRCAVDLSHPAVIDWPDLDRASLLGITALQRHIRESQVSRTRWIPDAERIVDEAVAAFSLWFRGRGVVPFVVRMREEVMQRALDEAERAGRGCVPEERERLRRLARSVARSMLHAPTAALRSVDPGSADGVQLMETTRALFGLADPDAPAVESRTS